MRHLTRCVRTGALIAPLVLACLAPAAARDANTALPAARAAALKDKTSKAPLHLSDADRTKVSQAVAGDDTEVTFKLKTTKSAQGFEPSVGATIPKSLKPHALPRPLIYELPALRNYGYLKLKHQVLIVDPMTHKIVDMMPEAS